MTTNVNRTKNHDNNVDDSKVKNSFEEGGRRKDKLETREISVEHVSDKNTGKLRCNYTKY